MLFASLCPTRNSTMMLIQYFPKRETFRVCPGLGSYWRARRPDPLMLSSPWTFPDVDLGGRLLLLGSFLFFSLEGIETVINLTSLSLSLSPPHFSLSLCHFSFSNSRSLTLSTFSALPPFLLCALCVLSGQPHSTIGSPSPSGPFTCVCVSCISARPHEWSLGWVPECTGPGCLHWGRYSRDLMCLGP